MPQLPDGVKRLEGNGLCSNVYFLETGNERIAIDAGNARRSTRLKGLTVESVVLTHGHFDHCGGLLNAEAKAFLHKSDLRMLDEMNAPYFPDYRRPENVFPLDFTRRTFGRFELEVIETPGHTFGSICLLEKNNGLLFSGDTLFADGVHGRTDLVGGDAGKMEESLELIKGLDYEILCPGHGGIEEK